MHDAVRGDLADVALADRVFAPHYAAAMAFRATAVTTLHEKPASDTTVIGSIAGGDIVDLFDISGGWAWVRAAGRMGYVPADAVAPA